MTRKIAKAFVAIVGVLSGCATDNSNICVAGQACTLIGRAQILPYSDAQEAWLEQENGCVALALKPDIYEAERARWNGRRVKVTGKAFVQPEGNFLFFDIDGRRVNGGACKAKLTLIVSEISEFAMH